MSGEKTKVECRLIPRGTNKANASVVDDLAVPDPEPAEGKQIIKEVTKEDEDVDGQSADS